MGRQKQINKMILAKVGEGANGRSDFICLKLGVKEFHPHPQEEKMAAQPPGADPPPYPSREAGGGCWLGNVRRLGGVRENKGL